MLRTYDTMRSLPFFMIADIYFAGCSDNRLRMEQQLYSYLADSFFRQQKSFYACWEEAGKLVSCLRVEPYLDGYLLTALQTHSEDRNKGYASKLVCEVLRELIGHPVYSHVSKSNIPSLRVHENNGFRIIKDSAKYLDGSFDFKSYTLLFR